MPTDSHVHTEWSWDTAAGSMERSCARAVDLGLLAIAFTEHVDHTVWTVDREAIAESELLRGLTSSEGLLTPPAFDAAGYLESVERCRDRYPVLRILTGLELGEPHWHAEAVAEVLGAGRFDRVLGSLHCLPDGEAYAEPPGLYAHRDPAEVMRTYLAEVAQLVAGPDTFSVLAHIDYPVRSWPGDARPFAPADFEEEFRHALRATAESGRALEISTRVPLHATIVMWWHEEGGQAVTFGSDAHDPSAIAWDFKDASQMAEAHGFRPGRDPLELWGRRD